MVCRTIYLSFDCSLLSEESGYGEYEHQQGVV